MFGTEIALIAFARCKWVFAMESPLNRSSVPNRFFFLGIDLKLGLMYLYSITYCIFKIFIACIQKFNDVVKSVGVDSVKKRFFSTLLAE